jgi:integrase/recombinase XerD
LRRYHAYLIEDRKHAIRTVVQHGAAIRFLYCKTLKRRDMKQDLPYPRNYKRRLPVVLSLEEVGRVLDAARNLFHRAMLMTVYSCGLRRIEACRLKVTDIDSQRMMIRISDGKGGVDRDVPLVRRCSKLCVTIGAGCGQRPGCSRVPRKAGALISRLQRK